MSDRYDPGYDSSDLWDDEYDSYDGYDASYTDPGYDGYADDHDGYDTVSRYSSDYSMYDEFDSDYEPSYEQPARRSSSSGSRGRNAARSRTSSRKSAGSRRSTEASLGRASLGRASGRASSGGRSASASRRSSSRNSSSAKKKSSSSAAPVAATVLLLIVMIGAFGVKLFLDKYSYSKEVADLQEYFSMSQPADGSGSEDVAIVWGDEISEIRARRLDGTYYLSLDAVKSNLNDRFYYGVQNYSDLSGMIMYCLPDRKVVTHLGSNEVLVGSETQTKSYIPARRIGDSVYLALDFVKEYTNFSFQGYEDPARLQIYSAWEPKNVGEISRGTQIRLSGGIKSRILKELEKGDQVTVLEQMETWSRVKSEDGFIGYVENKRIRDIHEETPTPVTSYVEPEYTTHMLGTKVNMAFHNVYSTAAANDTLRSFMAPTKSVNVIAPTIFWVKNAEGDITSMASQYYTDTAHAMGLKVWAVVDNINSPELVNKSSFLGTQDTRDNLINQLITECTTYGYDGINVDFELIEAGYGQDYVQFIRELSIACRLKGLTMSVDDYPAYEYNSYYNIREQGVFADYVVIMGYDEHYGGSSEAGSVASIGYVTDGIAMAVERIAKEKVINAVPFYTRYWKTTGGVVTSEAYGMKNIPEIIANHNMTVTWDAECGQNYAEATEGDTFLQIWIEDTQSLQLKLDAMTAAGIGGVAEWKLDFETPDVWDIIANYMNS